MDREFVLKQWNEAWESGLWAAAWSKVVEGLSAADAAWKPQPLRNSIWQNVEHMIFWREVAIRRATGGAGPTGPDDDEVKRRNFPDPADPSERAWNETLKRFVDSQRKVATAMADPNADIERLSYLVPHDSYHAGQIAYLRAMRGKPPLE